MKYQTSIRCLAIYVFRTYLKQQSLQNSFFKAQFQDHIFKIQNIYSKSLQLKKKKALSKTMFNVYAMILSYYRGSCWHRWIMYYIEIKQELEILLTIQYFCVLGRSFLIFQREIFFFFFALATTNLFVLKSTGHRKCSLQDIRKIRQSTNATKAFLTFPFLLVLKQVISVFLYPKLHHVFFIKKKSL